jgi:hypothetical protein
MRPIETVVAASLGLAAASFPLPLGSPLAAFDVRDAAAAVEAHLAAGWMTTTTYTAPWPRAYHSAVWAGSRMIVWGGLGSSGLPFFTGGLYDPVTDSWTPTTIVDAPSGRDHHTAVWTGTRMIVWGGYDSTGPAVLRTGGRYDPASDSWTATATTTAPSAREHHTAVWTGSRMIVWGGRDANGNLLNNGGQYDPASDSWTPIGTSGAPSPRYHHTAVWTGSHMVVWGGSGNGSSGLDTGGRYDPVAGSWTPTTTAGAPSPRWRHTGVWTSARMIVWGGYGNLTNNVLNTGARYDPAANTWAPTTTVGAPVPRVFHTTVAAGSRMIVWGGWSNGDLTCLETGGEYHPATDTWTATTIGGAPSERCDHAGVWTGSRMIVWGGYGAFGYLHTGGRYKPSFIKF